MSSGHMAGRGGRRQQASLPRASLGKAAPCFLTASGQNPQGSVAAKREADFPAWGRGVRQSPQIMRTFFTALDAVPSPCYLPGVYFIWGG